MCTETSIQTALSKAINDERTSDFVFIIEKKKIYTHRVILAHRSPVFEAMLFGNMKEARERQVEISDPSVKYKHFLEFLNYVYTEKTNITPDNVLFLLNLSKLYIFPSLQKECAAVVEKSIVPENALDLFVSARCLNEEEIATKCLLVLCNNITKLKEVSLLKVPASILAEIFATENLIAKEEDLFELVQIWLNQNNGTSITETNLLLSYIRFPQISAKFLATVVKPSKLLPVELYLEALEYQTVPDIFTSETLKEKRFQPRKASILYSKWVWVTTTFSEIGYLSDDKMAVTSSGYTNVHSSIALETGICHKFEIEFQDRTTCQFLGVSPILDPRLNSAYGCCCGDVGERYGITHNQYGRILSRSFDQGGSYPFAFNNAVVVEVDLVAFMLRLQAKGLSKVEISLPPNKMYYVIANISKGPVTVKHY